MATRTSSQCFNMNMLPNIKQRKNSKNKNSSSKKNKYRKKVCKDIQCINISL